MIPQLALVPCLPAARGCCSCGCCRMHKQLRMGMAALKCMERALQTEFRVCGGPLPLPGRLLHGLRCCCTPAAGQTWHTPCLILWLALLCEAY